MTKYKTIREIKKTKRTEAIKDRFTSGPEDITDIVRVKVLSASHKQKITAGMAKAKASGKVLGRKPFFENALKRSEKAWILKQADMGIKHSRIIKNVNEKTGIKISKASFSRLIKTLRGDL